MNEPRICSSCRQRRPALDFMCGRGRPRKYCITCAGAIGEAEARNRREAGWLHGSLRLAAALDLVPQRMT